MKKRRLFEQLLVLPVAVGMLAAANADEADEADETNESNEIKGAKEPVWWQHPEYQLKSPGARENNYGVLNLGQLKNMAAACALEFEQSLPGGAGPEILSMIRKWLDPKNKTNNHVVTNTGQLKNVAKMFYDRLIEEGYAKDYPWSKSKKKPNHFAVALVGQLKHLFDFDIEEDSDFDGLADMWEMATNGDLSKGESGSAPGPLPGFNEAHSDKDFDGVGDKAVTQ